MRFAPGLLFLMAACEPERVPPSAAGQGLDLRRWDPIRVVSWNIETVGNPGSTEYDAALDVLARLDADVVGIQEIADSNDEVDLLSLAADAGYPEVAIGDTSFGGDHNAIFSRRNLLSADAPSAAELSGDPLANDVTRDFVRVEVDTAGDPLTVICGHWKSGGTDEDEFRRSIEAARAVQAFDGLDPASDPIVVMGDLNEDPADVPFLFPSRFNSLPAGLPGSFWVGQDLFDEMIQSGIDNDPVAPFLDAGLTEVGATQRDGSHGTFIGSASALDHAFVSPALRLSGAEVFDDRDEALASVLHLATAPIASGTVEDGSDHHPLVLEVAVRR